MADVRSFRGHRSPHRPGRLVSSLRYHNVREHHAASGKGLGLIGLKDRVEALGGQLAVSSPVGGGYVIARHSPSEPTTMTPIMHVALSFDVNNAASGIDVSAAVARRVN
jgi:signal transduction histidine kinase